MKTLPYRQGTPEWLAERSLPNTYTASEAPAMLGLSKYKTRTELIREKATGITPEVDTFTQGLFDAGHEAEASTRAWAESEVGDDLYPVTGTIEIDGIRLLASFDGLTMDESIAWENKKWNQEFAAQVLAGEVPDTHWPQLEQQLLVSGADKVLFTVSDGGDTAVAHLWYTSQPDRRTRLIAGWKQFAEDVANYNPANEVPAEVVAGRSPDMLPALFVQVEGRVVAGDVRAYRAHVDSWVAKLPAIFETDQDFKDGAKAVKACEDAEANLKALGQQIRGQMADVDTVFRLLEESVSVIRDARLSIDSKVKANGKRIREQAVIHAGNEFREYVAALTVRIGHQMPFMPVDFGAAIKGLKTVASMNNAIGTALANAKIEASAIADRIQDNKEACSDCMHLFPDFGAMCQKEPADFQNLIIARQAEAERREAARIEAERASIRAEEQAKAEREARAKAEIERQEYERQEHNRRVAEQAEADAARLKREETDHQQAAEQAAQIKAQFTAKAREVAEADALSRGFGVNQTIDSHAVADEKNMQARAILDGFNQDVRKVTEMPVDTSTTIKLGEICARLGFAVTADFLAQLGFKPHAIDKNAKLYRECDFPRICNALIDHINAAMRDDVAANARRMFARPA